MITLTPHTKLWGDPSKVEARRTTIIEPYRAIFGHRVPDDQQYWTLCGEMARCGRLVPGCELDQVTGVGLARADQFHGVEGNPEIHRANVEACRGTGAHLYGGEFTDVLDCALADGWLRPGLVYLDSIQEPRGAGMLLARTLDILRYTTGNCMVVWNFIQHHRHRNRHHSWEDVAAELQRNALFVASIRHGWQQLGEEVVFRYDGTGPRSATTMGTVVFVRRCS